MAIDAASFRTLRYQYKVYYKYQHFELICRVICYDIVKYWKHV